MRHIHEIMLCDTRLYMYIYMCIHVYVHIYICIYTRTGAKSANMPWDICMKPCGATASLLRSRPAVFASAESICTSVRCVHSRYVHMCQHMYVVRLHLDDTFRTHWMYIYTHIYTCTHNTHTHISICVYRHTCVYVHIYIYICICIFRYACVCVYISIYRC